MATMTSEQTPLELLDRAIPGATNDAMLELCYRVLENLAERAESAADFAIDSDNRDAENEALVFVSEVDKLIHWSYHGRLKCGWVVSDAKKDLEVAARNRRERLNGSTTALEAFSARRRQKQWNADNLERIREEMRARATRKRAKVTQERVLEALAKAVVQSRVGDVRVADVIVALDKRLADTSIPGRQMVVADVTKMLRDLADEGRVQRIRPDDYDGGRRKPHRYAMPEVDDAR